MGSLGPTATVSMSMAKATTTTTSAVPYVGGKNGAVALGDQRQAGHKYCSSGGGGYGFQMPLHYPRYKKADYEAMPEWRVDCLLREYGLPVAGDLEAKRRFAMGAFLWLDQY